MIFSPRSVFFFLGCVFILVYIIFNIIIFLIVGVFFMVKKYDLNDRRCELVADICLFEGRLRDCYNVTQKLMFKNVIARNRRELEYLDEYIRVHGVCVDDYEFKD
jgi:hypothetical protein